MSWRARLQTAFHEVRFVVASTSPAGAGLRDYVGREYRELAALNPSLRLFLHHRDVPEPEVHFMDKNLKEEVIKVPNLSEEQVADKIAAYTNNTLAKAGSR